MRAVKICGMGGSAIDAFNDDGYEVWGLNNAYAYGKCDRLFIVDSFAEIAALSPYYNIPWWDAVKDSQIITKVPLEFGEINGVTRFSHKIGELEKCGSTIVKRSEVFNMEATLEYKRTIDLQCTLAYAIAQAIMEKVDKIELWGVEIWEFGATGFYGCQVQNINSWLDIALARGIKITIPYQILSKIMSTKRIAL